MVLYMCLEDFEEPFIDLVHLLKDDTLSRITVDNEESWFTWSKTLRLPNCLNRNFWSIAVVLSEG
jgi:hypothetical protein